MRDLKAMVERARALIGSIGDLRAQAVAAGTAPDEAVKIGAMPTAVALDALELAEELELHRTTGANMERIGALARELFGLVDGHGRAPHFGPDGSGPHSTVAETWASSRDGAAIDRLGAENAALVSKIAEQEETIRDLRAHHPPVERAPEQIAIPGSGPLPEANGAPVEPTTPKPRAPEKVIDVATWELDGRDFAALAKQGYTRETVIAQLPAFRAHHGALKTQGSRPRVTLAAWLARPNAA